MEFETVERDGRIYVIKNDIESTDFVAKSMGAWCLYNATFYAVAISLDEALAMIADDMDTWYTAAEAAAWLVEAGAFNKVSAHDVCQWARDGLLPGSIKIKGKGGAGQGGSWRIPQAVLEALMERKKGQ